MHWSTQITHEWIERRTPTYTYGDIRRPSVRPRPRVLCRIDITVRSYAQYLSDPIFDEDSDSQLHFGSFCHPEAVLRRFRLTFIHRMRYREPYRAAHQQGMYLLTLLLSITAYTDSRTDVTLNFARPRHSACSCSTATTSDTPPHPPRCSQAARQSPPAAAAG